MSTRVKRLTEESPDIDHESHPWHAVSIEEACKLQKTDRSRGLKAGEVARRLELYGRNELEEAPRPGIWHMLWQQFRNFIVILLIVAAVASAILHEYPEALAIMAIVIINAILGVVQEHRAEEALAALRKLAAPEAQVIRDGHRKIIPASELVPGDLVILEAGNYVPADLRLLETFNFRVEEAALTGESVAVDKDAVAVLDEGVHVGDRLNMAFMGTLAAYGRGLGLVVGTGMETEIGSIATMLQAVDVEETPLQSRLDQLGKVLGWAALGVCGLVFIVGFLRGFDLLTMFLVAVSLAVAAVPEGLPAVVTITLALGMRQMIQRNALVRRLASVETLGSTTVICSDKTGTLTQNRMTVTRLWVDGTELWVTGDGARDEGSFLLDGEEIDLDDFPACAPALQLAVMNSDAEIERMDADEEAPYRVVGDPTEVALIVAAAKAGIYRDDMEKAYPRIGEIPFDSTRKRMTTLHKIREPRRDLSHRDWEVAATKGAPDVILELCSHYQDIQDRTMPMDEAMRQRIRDANDALAQRALRVLAVAYRLSPSVEFDREPDQVEQGLTFVGLFGMIDPPRSEVPPAIRIARRAGIRTVMITGDYPNTARAIGEQIGLLETDHQVCTGTEIDSMDDEALLDKVIDSDIYARVSPEHKVRIVDALKRHRHVVAMTGDGVNDAPALKRADIGVAMGITGTDVAKETADMVLTDDNYASIVDAVEQGRVIYANIRKFVFYLLSCNLAEITVILLAILAGLRSPLTAIQLLWLNLVTDGLPALALGLEKGDPDTMDIPPRPPEEPVINRSMWLKIGIQTVAISAVTLTAYLLGLSFQPDMPDLAATMAFVTLSFSELLRAFTSRSESYPLFKIGLFSNQAMVYAFASSLLLLLFVIYTPFLQPIFNTVPLGWKQWAFVLPLLFVPSLVAEVTKWVLRRRMTKAKR
ncbi:MAG: cation-translocating P-type ATPase [Anaerolineales bacterium]